MKQIYSQDKHTGIINCPKNHESGFSLIEMLVSAVILSIGLLGLASLHFEGLKKGNESFYKTMASIQANDLIDRMRANRDAVNNGYYDNHVNQMQTTSNVKCLGGVENGQSGKYDSTQSSDSSITKEDVFNADGTINEGFTLNADGTVTTSDGITIDLSITAGTETTGTGSGTVGSTEQTISSQTSSEGCDSQQIASQDLYEWSKDIAQTLPDGESTVCRTSNPGPKGSTVNCDGAGDLMVININWRSKEGGVESHRVTFRP